MKLLKLLIQKNNFDCDFIIKNNFNFKQELYNNLKSNLNNGGNIG